jgi:hypothetical protein
MKFKALPIIHRAVYEGISIGLERSLATSKQLPEGEDHTEMIVNTLTDVVLSSLATVIDFQEITTTYAEQEPSNKHSDE